MKSAIVKHSVVIKGHKTSVSLEQPFWAVVREIAVGEGTTVSAVLRRVDAARQQANLSSAVRVFALEHVRAQAAAAAREAQAAARAGTLPPPTKLGPVSPLPLSSTARQPRA